MAAEVLLLNNCARFKRSNSIKLLFYKSATSPSRKTLAESLKKTPKQMKIKILILSSILFLISSCATKYVTPGGDVKISALADEDISKVLSNKPSAEFPVTIAVARIQAPKYTNNRYSYRN